MLGKVIKFQPHNCFMSKDIYKRICRGHKKPPPPPPPPGLIGLKWLLAHNPYPTYFSILQ